MMPTGAMDTIDVWRRSLGEARAVLDRFLSDPRQLEACAAFTERLTATFERGGTLFTCGNGGSHCDAMHFAEECTGRYRRARRPLGALALGDPSHVTCVANDYGFEHVFSRQLEGLGRAGDVLVGISTSGQPRNIALALETARRKSMHTVALLGGDGGMAKDLAELVIVVPGETTDRIQELHIKIIHTVIEAVERRLFPENYR
jgi:D-sedoheptulose 7-phosphate isomerase